MRDFDSHYLDIAFIIAKMSRAKRAQVGALLVKDNNILSYGYNGTPSGFDNNCEHNINGQLVTRPEVIHAESNALMKVAKSTLSSNGATMYLTMSPCYECSKLMIQAGVKKVVFPHYYRDVSPITFLEQMNIEVIKYEGAILMGREISPTDNSGLYFTRELEEDVYNP